MNARLHLPSIFAAALVFSAAPFASADSGPAYLLVKGELLNQTSASAPSPDANIPYIFGFQSTANDNLTPPGLSVITPAYVSGNSDYEIDQSFGSLSGLNTAFPDGSYSISGTGITTTSAALTGALFSSVAPQITSGVTWLTGGVAVIDATAGNTLNFSTYTGYTGTTGSQVAGHEQVKIYPLSTGGNSVGQEIATQAIFGLTQASAPFTSFAIPANTLANGNNYMLKLDFDALSDLDSTSLSAAGIVALYRKETVAFIITQQGTTAKDTAPAITAQPVSLTGTNAVPANSTAVFNFGVNFDSSSSVVFFFNGQGLNIDGVKYAMNTTQTGVSLSVNNVAATDAGSYFAVFVNPGGVVESQPAALAVAPAVLPTITTDLPLTTSLNTGSTLVLTPVVTGNPTTYQWFFNGVQITADSPSGTTSDIISGSSGPQLEIINTTAASSGAYKVKAINSAGSVISATDTVAISTVGTPGFLVNISARAFVGTNSNILIGGFYVGGNTARTVLIQGIGPALSGQVAGTLAKPSLALYDTNGVKLYSNTGWGSNPVLSAAAASAYATPVLPANSPDSELFLTLPPGGYTAQISGADGGTGVALCAIYMLQ